MQLKFKAFVIETILDNTLDGCEDRRVAAETHSKVKHFMIRQIQDNYLMCRSKYPFDYIKVIKRDPESDSLIDPNKPEPHFFYV